MRKFGFCQSTTLCPVYTSYHTMTAQQHLVIFSSFGSVHGIEIKRVTEFQFWGYHLQIQSFLYQGKNPFPVHMQLFMVPLYFLPCGVYLSSSFFPCLISVVGDVYHTSTHGVALVQI